MAHAATRGSGRNEGLFGDIALSGKAVLDIGGGAGWASFYAAAYGARRVVMVEPEGSGSRSDILQVARDVRSELCMEPIVEIVPTGLQEAAIKGQFDIIVIDKAVNHLDEDACKNLHCDAPSQRRYRRIFRITRREAQDERHDHHHGLQQP